MLDSILKGLASETSDKLVNQAGVSQDKVGDMLKITGDVATSEIKEQVSKGGLDTVMNLFSNNSNTGLANQLQGGLQNKLVSKFISMLGLSEEKSQMAAGIIVPILLNLVTKENSKTPDNDPSPLESIFGSVLDSKGGGGGLGGIVKGLFK